ncbi:hypothetical protein Syun_025003 [Stephania yunnanensis]|uniref:Uncharacterized protein n=1 Tax=Stephania yunnanensis TaxID=152371 RepID=A0AAP0EXY5_9MAGN
MKGEEAARLSFKNLKHLMIPLSIKMAPSVGDESPEFSELIILIFFLYCEASLHKEI